MKSPKSLLAISFLLLFLLGCSRPQYVVEGTISVEGQPVNGGRLRFVPVGQTPGQAVYAPIREDGTYQADARGGVFAGTYRVEVWAQQKTGRRIQAEAGVPGSEIDEVIPVGAKSYGGGTSPLEVSLPAPEGGPLNIDLPSR